ncbi:MAG: TolC family protein [Verrucomicrobia bacterium]|nr:TolC family protein [Verrucomicrobiota bacterium]
MRIRPLLLFPIFWTCSLAFAGGTSSEPNYRNLPLTLDYRNHPLTLDEAVDLSLRQSPSILNQIQQLKRQKGIVYTAQARMFPQLTGTANYNQSAPSLVRVSPSGQKSALDLLAVPSGQPLVITPAGQTNAFGIPISALSSGSTTPTESWTVELAVTQLLWDGGATIANRRSARINEESAYFSLRDTIDQVVENVRIQFNQILLDRALIQVQEESVNLLKSQLADQESRFEAGTVPQFNVLQAQSQLENQIPQLIAAQNNYRIAQAQLAKTLGIGADRQYTTDEPLPVVGTLNYASISYDLGSALITARANRPALKAFRENILSAEEQVTVALAGFQPLISASAGLEARSDPTSSNLKNSINGWLFSINGSWNIFDGGTTYGNVKQARAQLEQAKVNFDDQMHQVELDVSTAVNNLRESQETILSATKAVEVSQEALRLADERLAAGTGTQLDVLNAQTQLTTSRSNLVQAQFNYISAVAQFQFATGTEVRYNDKFDNTSSHPTTLTAVEAKKAHDRRFSNPLDPDTPATIKSKRESLIPPKGKVTIPID